MTLWGGRKIEGITRIGTRHEKSMKVADIGEFGLISRIAGLLPRHSAGVLVGIGDDVAVLEFSPREVLLATCDIQVEEVHFCRSWTTPRQLGRKVVAINVSDIAAMGGVPAWALVSLALPQDTDVEFVEELYGGMQEQISEGGGAIVGGNTSAISCRMVIDLFLMGKADPERIVRRSGARVGDLVFVTGFLGDSMAGLELMRRPELKVDPFHADPVLERQRTPRPRLREGQCLASSGKVHAMVDVSDGLWSDVGHICRASGVGAEIRLAELPVSDHCIEVARAAGKDFREWALTGGEDYELLFAVAADQADEVERMVLNETGTPCRPIGRFVAMERGVVVSTPEKDRFETVCDTRGWDHFR